MLLRVAIGGRLLHEPLAGLARNDSQCVLEFSDSRPNATSSVALSKMCTTHTMELPELQSSNVLVEVSGGGLARARAYYANALEVEMERRLRPASVLHEESEKLVGTISVKVDARPTARSSSTRTAPTCATVSTARP